MGAGGVGSLYRRGDIWWISLRHNGKKIQESTKTSNEAKARQILAEVVARVAGGTWQSPHKAPPFDAIWDLLVEDYRANQKNMKPLTVRLKHLRPYFAEMRAPAIDLASILVYRKLRIEEGAAPASVNRELAALSRALRLAHRLGMIRDLPHIEKLHEANVRTTWFSRDQFERLLAELPDYFRRVAQVGYITGWRISELLGLTWDHVDFPGARLILKPGETKNRDGRMFSLAHPELREILKAQREWVSAIEAEKGVAVPWVFCHKNGTPIKYHYTSWRKARDRAGLAGYNFHDFRRSAVRNLEAAGIPRSIAMAMVGHKTENVFRRYAIVNETDMHAAALKLGARHRREKGAAAESAKATKIVNIEEGKRKAAK